MNRHRTRLVIVGGSFGGVNAAYELRKQLGGDAEITLISRERDFTFMPSLPWVILGWRQPAALGIPLEQPLQRRDIRFVHATVESLDPAKGEVRTATAVFGFDVVVITTGGGTRLRRSTGDRT